jgi:TRAP-type C4-dicarboxylate transport system permease small subunit
VKYLEKFTNTLTLMTTHVAKIALAFAMLIIVANVISRIWGSPVPGTVELVEISGAVLLSMAVAYTAIKKGHIMVSVLVDKFPIRIQAIVDVIINTVALFFIFLLAREGFVFANRMMDRGYVTGFLNIPISPAIFTVCFGFSMLCLVLILDIVKAVTVAAKRGDKV